MSELKKAALLIGAIAAAFKANPETDKLLVTEDGNCFLPSNKSFAEAHARRNNFKVQEVDKEEFEKNNQAVLKAVAEKEAAEKGAAEKEAAEKAAAEKEAAEKAAAEKEAAEKASEKTSKTSKK